MPTPVIRSLLALSLLAPSAADPATPELPPEAPDLPRHELVFARHGDDARSHYDLWRMCGDGTQLASLVVEPGTQFQVSVSPDGEEIVYTGRVDDRSDLWRRPFGRGKAVNLTDHPARDTGPAHSPDGKRLAFFSDRDAERPELYLLDLADGTIERLTDNGEHDSLAAWTPDGGERRVLNRAAGTEAWHVWRRGGHRCR